MIKRQPLRTLLLTVATILLLTAPQNAAEVLFVGGQPDAAQGDDPFVLEHLEDVLGHTVTYMTGDESATGDVEGMDLLIISSTLGSGSARGKFQDSEIPILQWEEALVRWDHGNPDGNFRMSQNSRNGQGRETSFIVISESAVGHPLAGGLEAGEHEIFDDFNRTPQQFGELAPGLIRIGELDEAFALDDASFWTDENGDEQEGPEFVYTAIDKGDELGPPGEGYFAPEKRVNFPIEDLGFGILNDTGLMLFDCSIDWLLGGSCVDVGMAGDFNDNGEYDLGDIDLLTVASASGNNDASYDLTGDGAVDSADVTFWAHDLQGTWLGDSNLDNLFNSSDFVKVFTEGKFETGSAAVWSQGDWNGDGVFNSGDFVAAFIDGGYEIGNRPAGVAVVPEPSSAVLLLLGALFTLRMRRR